MARRIRDWYLDGWFRNSAYLMVVESWDALQTYPIFIAQDEDPLEIIWAYADQHTVKEIYSYETDLEQICKERNIKLSDVIFAS